MTKGNSKSKPQMQENIVKDDKEKVSLEYKKPGQEIDDIFSTKKKKSGQEKTPKMNGVLAVKEKQMKRKKAGQEKAEVKERPMKNSKKNKDTGTSVHSSRPRKQTGDGLVIYTEEELGFGKSEGGELMEPAPMTADEIAETRAELARVARQNGLLERTLLDVERERAFHAQTTVNNVEAIHAKDAQIAKLTNEVVLNAQLSGILED